MPVPVWPWASSGKVFVPTATTASIILRYPVQRHKTPAKALATSSAFGVGFLLSKETADTIIPGVQIPH